MKSYLRHMALKSSQSPQVVSPSGCDYQGIVPYPTHWWVFHSETGASGQFADKNRQNGAPSSQRLALRCFSNFFLLLGRASDLQMSPRNASGQRRFVMQINFVISL